MNCHVHTSLELNTKEQEAGVAVQSFVETVNASVGCKPVSGWFCVSTVFMEAMPLS